MNDYLMTRALWLCGQVPRLHEMSYDMGVNIMAIDPAHTAAMQNILEVADKLQVDIANHIKKQNKPVKETA